MSNEKLREALRELMSIVSIHQKATRNNFAWAEMDFAREALATTEQRPKGMPELPEPDLLIDADLDSDAPYRACSVDLMRDYGEQCWKAGYKHGAWGDKPAVNQQLTTEPLTNDTKVALMAGRAYAQEALIRFDDAYDRHPSTEPERNAILTDIQLIDDAMAQGVKG